MEPIIQFYSVHPILTCIAVWLLLGIITTILFILWFYIEEYRPNRRMFRKEDSADIIILIVGGPLTLGLFIVLLIVKLRDLYKKKKKRPQQNG